MSDAGLPQGWAVAPLEAIAADVPHAMTDGPFGSNLKSDHYTDSGPRVMRLQNIGEGVFVDAHAHISAEHFARLRKHSIEAGDLIVAILGERLPRACMLPPDVGPAIVKADCIRVAINRLVAEPKYVNWWLNSSRIQRQVTAKLKGVGRPRMNLSQLRSLSVAVPPLAEQRRMIAKIEELFSDLDAGVAALERVRANLKRYRAAVLKAAVEGRLTEEWRTRHPATEPAAQLLERILAERRAKWEQDQLRKFKEAGKTPPKGWKEKYKQPAGADHGSLHALPDGWTWAIADQLCSQVTDGEHIQPPYQTTGKPMLTATHVRDDGVRFENVGLIAEDAFDKALKRCSPTEGDLLIVSVGATTGRAGVVGPSEPFAIVRSVLLLKPLISSKYLLRWVQSPWCNRWIGGASGATAQAHFYISDAKRMPIPLPPAAELSEIVAEVDRRLSVADAAETQVEHALQRAARLRQAILKRAFEGKLVPQDPTDEPAEGLLNRLIASSSEQGSRSRRGGPRQYATQSGKASP